MQHVLEKIETNYFVKISEQGKKKRGMVNIQIMSRVATAPDVSV
jgi:hypothetical protein